MQVNLDFSVFKTGSTVYKCQHMPWKYGGACLFVFVSWFCFLVVCVCVFFLPCAKYKIRL